MVPNYFVLHSKMASSRFVERTVSTDELRRKLDQLVMLSSAINPRERTKGKTTAVRKSLCTFSFTQEAENNASICFAFLHVLGRVIVPTPCGLQARSLSSSLVPAKSSSLWALVSPMDDGVQRALTSNGLDRYVTVLAEMGIETPEDLANPYVLSDAQLKKAGMSVLVIRRFRRVGEEMALQLQVDRGVSALVPMEEGDEGLDDDDNDDDATTLASGAGTESRGASVGGGGAGGGAAAGAGGLETRYDSDAFRNALGGSGGDDNEPETDDQLYGDVASSRPLSTDDVVLGGGGGGGGGGTLVARGSRLLPAEVSAAAAVAATQSFVPLLAELGLEAFEAALVGACGGEVSWAPGRGLEGSAHEDDDAPVLTFSVVTRTSDKWGSGCFTRHHASPLRLCKLRFILPQWATTTKPSHPQLSRVLTPHPLATCAGRRRRWAPARCCSGSPKRPCPRWGCRWSRRASLSTDFAPSKPTPWAPRRPWPRWPPSTPLTAPTGAAAREVPSPDSLEAVTAAAPAVGACRQRWRRVRTLARCSGSARGRRQWMWGRC